MMMMIATITTKKTILTGTTFIMIFLSIQDPKARINSFTSTKSTNNLVKELYVGLISNDDREEFIDTLYPIRGYLSNWNQLRKIDYDTNDNDDDDEEANL